MRRKITVFLGILTICIVSVCFNFSLIGKAYGQVQIIQECGDGEGGGSYPGTCCGSYCKDNYTEHSENYLCCWEYTPSRTGRKKATPN